MCLKMKIKLFNYKTIKFETIQEFYNYENFNKTKIYRINSIIIKELIKHKVT